MGINIARIFLTIFILIFTINIVASLDDPLINEINTLEQEINQSNTSITQRQNIKLTMLNIQLTIYWILISIVILVELIVGLGLDEIQKKLEGIKT